MTKILCIEDDPIMRLVASDYLKDLGHQVLEAPSGEEGLALFEQHHPDLVLSNIRLPNDHGFLVVEHVTAAAPTTPVVVIADSEMMAEVANALRIGAWDYISKPITDLPRLAEIVDRVLREAWAHRAATQYLLHLEAEKQDLERKVLRWMQRFNATVNRFEAAMAAGINALHIALHEKDPYTAGHNENVAKLSVEIAATMGLGNKQIATLNLAGLLHDIGKLAIPKIILNKRDSLDFGELETIRNHVACGYRILRDIPFEGPVAEAVLQHHERYDGTGYPKGLTGDAILLEARILAVADVYEALCSNRPYRAGLSPYDAENYIVTNAGTHFCPCCVAAFERVIVNQHMGAMHQ